MAISVQCACGKSLSAKDELAGRRVKCPACQQPLLIPAAQKPVAATSISARCDCGETFNAKPESAGKTVKCPKCANPVQIPEGPAQAAEPGVKVTCACGNSLNAPPRLAGKTVRCPACKSPLAIPKAVLTDATADSDADSATGSDIDFDLSGKQQISSLHDQGIDSDTSGMAGLLDELGIESSKTGRRCPNCSSDVEPDAILCIDCGYNLDTGKKLKQSSFVKAKKLDGIGAPPKKKKAEK